MSFSVLEQLRSAHEDLENLEKAMSRVVMDKHKNPKLAVACDHSLKWLLDQSQGKCSLAVDIYQDKDGMRTDDINSLAGHRGDKRAGDVWTSFYDKVKEVKDYHRRFTVNHGLPEIHSADWFYTRALEADNTANLFSGEESTGTRVDLNEHFMRFINLKKLKAHRKNKFREAAFARMKRKNPELEPDDPDIAQIVDEEYQEVDYITFLKEIDQFHEIPRYCKYKQSDYFEYLTGLGDYLRSFLVRTQPIFDLKKLEERFEEEFSERWSEGSIPGWQEKTHQDQLFSLPSNRLFNNAAVLKSHKSGKQYKKRLEEMQKMSFDDQQKLVFDSEAEDRKVARLESLISKYHDVLGDLISETMQHLQKKQSQTTEEMEIEKNMDDDNIAEDALALMSDDEDSDMDKEELMEDRPIYNPLNLPLGWDGKPIPFWLYKLHGLGIEHKCEICGNYSYWGRRAFERHFQEWRHAFGMRCLKIPNTAHFKEITKIEDAITLYDKLKRDAEEQTFRPDHDVECEDIQGNVMSQRAFEDLRRQGLV